MPMLMAAVIAERSWPLTRAASYTRAKWPAAAPKLLPWVASVPKKSSTHTATAGCRSWWAWSLEAKRVDQCCSAAARFSITAQRAIAASAQVARMVSSTPGWRGCRGLTPAAA